MVIFEKTRLKNFLSYGNTMTEIEWNKFPTTLLTSKNGNGKSAIIDSLCFGLFGKAYRNINKPQLINSINEKDCLVEVEFTIGTNKYKVRRGLKPVIFEIYVNDKMLDQSDKTKDQQKYLEQNILKFNYKTFTQVVILGSTSYIPFMELAAAERRSLVEDLLDIKVFAWMNTLAKQKISDLNKEYDTTNYNMSLVKEKIKIHQSNIQKQQEAKQKDAEYITSKIKESQDQINSLTASYNQYQKEYDELSSKMNEYDKDNKNYTESCELIKKLEDKQVKLMEDIRFYEKVSVCPSCKQNVDETTKNQFIQQKNDILTETINAVRLLAQKQVGFKQGVIASNNLHNEKNCIQIKMMDISTSIGSLNKFIQKMNDDLTNTVNDVNVSDEQLRLDEYQKEYDSLETHRHDIVEDQQYYNVATSILKDSGIKTQIISQYLPVMNNLINKYLTELNFFINFTLDEEFKEKMLSRYRDDFTYASFSEGEKFRINLSLLLTWREIAKMKNSLNTNLLIFDEVFDSSLDSTGTEDVLRLIKSMTNTNIFMISHKNEIVQDKFDRVLGVEKVGNFSKIIGE